MGRAPCCDKSKVKKGPWSPEEDATLKNYLQQHGTHGNWVVLPSKAGLNRCGKSCRLRWLNYLRPDIKRGSFTEGEENLICTLFATIGSRWSFIASQLPGRTDNDVKNYWNTKLKKKVLLAPGNNGIMATTNDNSTDLNLPQFSASIPKIETPLHDHETKSYSSFDGTLPYQMDVSCLGQGKQNFNPCSQFSHSNLMEVSSVPTLSTLALENNWTLCSGNEGVNDSSGFLVDFGFESPADVILDGFGY